MSRWRFLAVACVLTLILLAVGLAPGGTPTATAQDVSPPHFSASEARLADAQIYAKHMGVSVDEAARRFDLQDAAGNLDAELSRKESATFAGLWVQHTPDFRVVVRVTHNGADVLAPYVQRAGLVGWVDVRPADATLVALQKAQSEAMEAVRRAGLEVESEINVYENRVQLYVIDRVGLEAAL